MHTLCSIMRKYRNLFGVKVNLPCVVVIGVQPPRLGASKAIGDVPSELESGCQSLI
jgi:hypothetical protein